MGMLKHTILYIHRPKGRGFTALTEKNIATIKIATKCIFNYIFKTFWDGGEVFNFSSNIIFSKTS